MTELFVYYCFDTSALLSMWRHMYPPLNFPSVWQQMQKHIVNGEIVIPREVYEELHVGNDDLYQVLCISPIEFIAETKWVV